MRLSPRWPDSFSPVWNQLQQLQSEMNRLFERWTDGGRMPGSSASAYPPVNVWEDTDSIHVEAEIPGLSLTDLEIFVTGGRQLSIKGERKHGLPDKGTWHRQERSYGGFVRTLVLPCDVNRDNVDARFENGILQVKLAKAESAKPRKIVVRAE
jgi:HSP20 family protein